MRWRAAIPKAVLAMLLIVCGLPAQAGARHYKGEGLVLGVNRDAKTITISHREFPGLMPAMVMEFAVAPSEKLSGIEPGTRITFELVTGAHYVVKHVQRVPIPPLDHAELAPRTEVVPLRIGDIVPDFELTDQHGQTFRLSRLRGRLTAINFIYSRCPVPDMCPRLSANFAYLQRHFDGRLELVSITLDPKWDTPSVLLEYATRWNADPSRWYFVTGAAETIRQVAGEFGVQYWVEEDALTHGSAVGIIGPDGRLAARVDGSSYPVRELADLISAQLGVR